MAINLKTYRENKEVIKSFRTLNEYFNNNFPEKSWGWVALTSLLFSSLAMENYLTCEKNLDPKFKPALKTVLWQYINVVSNTEVGKE